MMKSRNGFAENTILTHGFVLFSTLCVVVSGKLNSDAEIMLEIKKSVSDLTGILSSWKSETSHHHCSWYGVTCNSESRVVGISITGNSCSSPPLVQFPIYDSGKYKRICLFGTDDRNRTLVGKLSPLIGSLTELRVLSLRFNELGGEIPTEIWGLRNLQVIDLEGNRFTGKLSNRMKGLRKLRVLNLGFNLISGQIPISLADCKGLWVLNLAGNKINGRIPWFLATLIELRTLYLSRNQLTGSVSVAFGVHCLNLEYLDLSGNLLTGGIPRGLGKCRRLRTLKLFSNQFEGAIPREYGQLHKLEVLDVSKNRLIGTLPVELGNCVQLSVLVLSNVFDPMSGVSCHSMYESNSFQGSIPIEVTTLPRLKVIWAPRAGLHGEFPSNWGQCDKLEMVNLAENVFDGVLSNTFERCTNLKFLNVSSNKLTGELGDKILPPSLNIFDMRHNNMSRTLLSKDNSRNRFHRVARTLLLSNNTLLNDEAPSSGGNMTSSWKSGLTTIEIASVVSASAIFSVLLALIALYFYTRKWAPNSRVQVSESREITVFTDIGVPLTYDSIVRATGYFHTRFCIGFGGFGATYKAEINSHTFVAVKKLAVGRFQGVQQFHAEIRTLETVRHPNLVTLIGYHATETEMFLIYNYLPGGNLEKFINDKSEKTFDWRVLHKIALHTAKALAYLHDQCRVLHRDVKPSNILLDNNLNAYLSDFGLARLLGTSETHATTGVAGTFGYVAPEYAMTCRVSEKSDVYSYGVVLLELISDKKALDPSFSSQEDGFNIVSWACLLLRHGQAKDVFKTPLWDSGPHDKLVDVLHLAVMCTMESLTVRPTMKQVAQRLIQLQPPSS